MTLIANSVFFCKGIATSTIYDYSRSESESEIIGKKRNKPHLEVNSLLSLLCKLKSNWLLAFTQTLNRLILGRLWFNKLDKRRKQYSCFEAFNCTGESGFSFP